MSPSITREQQRLQKTPGTRSNKTFTTTTLFATAGTRSKLKTDEKALDAGPLLGMRTTRLRAADGQVITPPGMPPLDLHPRPVRGRRLANHLQAGTSLARTLTRDDRGGSPRVGCSDEHAWPPRSPPRSSPVRIASTDEPEIQTNDARTLSPRAQSSLRRKPPFTSHAAEKAQTAAVSSQNNVL